MNNSNRHILVIDDNQAIHADFRKILAPRASSEFALDALAAKLLGEQLGATSDPEYQIDFAFQGEEALHLVERAQAENNPYSMAFLDVRMPPGWDGIETATRIWEQDESIQIVICTAYSDHTWADLRQQLGHSDRLVILKKPFDNIEVLQLAEMLSAKWQLAQHAQRRLAELERIIRRRTHELQTSNLQLDMVNRQLSTTAQQAQQAMSTQARYRRVMADELRQALTHDEFSLHYQPLIDITTRRIVSLEALLRWQHPKDGNISPATFIPVAEDCGLIVPIGEFVLRTVCEQVVSWERQGIPVVPVAVNLSAVQLERVDVAELVRRLLHETGMRPQLLALEITETSLIKDAQTHLPQLQALRHDGVRIMIDDFGTGYSSLSYLKHLPIDTIKIDRSFISQVDTNSQDETIVTAILTMAHTLGFRVVAEGVETAAQFEVLRKHGCEVAQGFYFSPPLSVEGCGELLLGQRPQPSGESVCAAASMQRHVVRQTALAGQRD